MYDQWAIVPVRVGTKALSLSINGLGPRIAATVGMVERLPLVATFYLNQANKLGQMGGQGFNVTWFALYWLALHFYLKTCLNV
ncbi:hypothetical protein D3C86_1591250 [compost metagenome]